MTVRNLTPSFFEAKARKYRPTWNVINPSTLGGKEQEILNKIGESISSRLNVPVTVFDGGPQESERGLRLFPTGFASSDINSPFVICKQMLENLAADEAELHKFMDRLERMIASQIENNSALQHTENYISQRDAERRSQQARLNILTATDFWNENSDGSWTHLSQGQATLQKFIALQTQQ
ncbi:MAG: hypothetical protein FWF81_10970 [Defluviitaleaceae bacterium]|nr:hypothetical protein [Defluviitaleaceae bacterium]